MDGKPDLDPDAASESYARNLAGYLKMLGHLHGWFEDSILRIPSEITVPNSLLDDRSALYLAEAWNQLEEHWGRIQYFPDSTVRCEERPYPSFQGVREVDTIIFEHDWQYPTDVEIARSRLRRQVFEITMHVLHSPAAENVQDPTDNYVELFPPGLISISEAASALALDMCYGLNVGTDAKEYHGLRLNEWLRGYALLQLCCQQSVAVIPIANGACYLDVGAFVNLAGRAGMTRSRTLLFIGQVTFQKNSRDLFDAPLIRTADDRYVILSCIFRHCAIHETLVSRLNSLLLQVDNKGTVFEREVREEFSRLGATAARIEYKNGEGKFECDAAVSWQQDLFLVECKAYTLPQPSPSSLFFFRLKQNEAAEQIERVARHLSQDPLILTKASVSNSEVQRTTLCVVNLAPFSLPGINKNVKFYDRRALSKFCEGTINAVVLVGEGPRRSSRETPIRRLWTDESPVPDDLLRQMNEPFQYTNEAKMWSVRVVDLPLSNEMVMASSFLVRRADLFADIPAIADDTSSGPAFI